MARTHARALTIVTLIILSTFLQTSYSSNLTIASKPEKTAGFQIGNSEKLNLKKTASYGLAGEIVAVRVIDSFAYLADQKNGLVIIDVSNTSKPIFVSQFQEGTSGAFDLEVRNKRIFLAHGASGLVIVDVSDPYNIEKIASFNDGGFAIRLALEVDRVFLVDSIQGIEIIDISNLGQLTEISQYPGTPLDVVVGNQHLFVAAGWGKKLEIVDVSNIDNPLKVSEIGERLEDTIGVSVSGNKLFVAKGSAGLEIVNIGKPKKPFVVAKYATPKNGEVWSIEIQNNLAYISEEFAGVEVIDFSDNRNPYVVARFREESSRSFQISLQNDTLFVADYNYLSILDWKTAPPVSATNDYSLISVDTLEFEHSTGTFGLEATVGNETQGANFSLGFNVGLSSPIIFETSAPQTILPQSQTNVIVKVNASKTYFWSCLSGEFSLWTTSGSTGVISLDDFPEPPCFRIALFNSFIGENLTRDTNVVPITIWQQSFLNVTLSLVLTPEFDISGLSRVTGAISNDFEKYDLNWDRDGEYLFTPITLPESKEEEYSFQIENVSLGVQDIVINMDKFRFDLIANDLIILETWYLNYTDITNNTLAKQYSSEQTAISTAEVGNATLFFLDGTYRLGEFIITLRYTTQRLAKWLIIIVLLGSSTVLALPWLLVIWRTKTKAKMKDEQKK